VFYFEGMIGIDRGINIGEPVSNIISFARISKNLTSI
jgi:hypothetical protein